MGSRWRRAEFVSGRGLQHKLAAGTRERVQPLGGSLEFVSAPGQGTTVIVRLPPAA